MTMAQKLRNLSKLNTCDLRFFLNQINFSQKDEQALFKIQENDKDRVGRIVMDITTTKTRWNYNSQRLKRFRRLWTYTNVTNTAAQKLEWTQKKNSCEQAVI